VPFKLQLLDIIPVIRGQHEIRFVAWVGRHSQILAGITLFPPEVLEHNIKATRKQRSQQRAEPVDPKVAGEAVVYDRRTERAGGIQRAASEVNPLISQ
jgi:hypothetical protein